MTQTIIMLAAATNLVAVACFVTANRIAHVIFLQFFPALLAVGLSVFAIGRFMGWPT